MLAGTRETKKASNYRHNKLYAYAKAFAEAVDNMLVTEGVDLFQEPLKALHNTSSREAMKQFFCENSYDPENKTLCAEDIEEIEEGMAEQFENDMVGINENTYLSAYAPMVGMALPIHKLILMNNVFSQGNGIQKVTALAPNFTISLERRILVTPDGTEIDMFLQQNQIADAIDATAPIVKMDINLPEKGTTDIIAALGGTTMDKLSMVTKIAGIFVPQVYIAEGDILPDADGWISTKGKVATAADAGLYDVWFRVQDAIFTPYYGGPNHNERILNRPVTIRYKTDAAGTEAIIKDTLMGTLDNNKLNLTTINGSISKVKLAAKLDTSNAMLDACSVTWKINTDYVEIPEATPINTTVSPEEIKDIAAMYDANQITKIMSLTKTALSEKKDKNIKDQLDESFLALDERTSFMGDFDFLPPEGYALDPVTWRHATFMDYFDDYVTRMLQVLNDDNMTITIFGDPRIVRKITPTEYAYQAPANIGPVTLDYEQTIVNTKDHRVYNFVGSDKMRGTNELMVLLNPRNSERICYRIYDYQLYISNEIRNANNPSLPAIHAFERWLLKAYQPVQGRIVIKNPTGLKDTVTA